MKNKIDFFINAFKINNDKIDISCFTILLVEDNYVQNSFNKTFENSSIMKTFLHSLDEALDICLEYLDENVEITIYTDQTYISNGYSKWLKSWVKSKFKKDSIKYSEIWKSINSKKILLKNVKVFYTKTPEHKLYLNRAKQMESNTWKDCMKNIIINKPKDFSKNTNLLKKYNLIK